MSPRWSQKKWSQKTHPSGGAHDRALLAELLSHDGQRVSAAASAFLGSGPGPVRRTQLCSKLLEALRDPQRPAVERASAGDALGSIGDPRFDRDCWYLPLEEAAGFLEVPSGSFAMGSDSQRDSMADGDESPRHTATLPTYYIARYPVTVRQFREFAAVVLRNRNFDAQAYKTHRPVIMVSWVDAQAYCAWIGERLAEVAPGRLQAATSPRGRAFWQGLTERRLRIRLPSEAEWERAARGEKDRIFPWGGLAESGKANTMEEQILRPTPVGAMPGGASPCGCEEMSGNVWEMTRSAWGAYPYDPARESHLTSDPRLRAVIRGGSFLSPLRLARCAVRDHVPKGREGQDLGFRLVATPAGAEGPGSGRPQP